MKMKETLFGLAFALGLVFTASYSIDNRGFHSGLYGIVGCVLILAAYVGFNWQKIKAGNSHTRHLLWGLGSLLAFIIVLDILEVVLA